MCLFAQTDGRPSVEKLAEDVYGKHVLMNAVKIKDIQVRYLSLPPLQLTPQVIILELVLKKPMFDVLNSGMRRVLDEVSCHSC